MTDRQGTQPMQSAPSPSSAIAGLSVTRAAGATEETAQFITFTIDAVEYGIDIMVVREIKGWAETTPIPKAPQHMRGVINLRGVIVPIFDLRARFGMGLTEPTRMHVVIIVDAGTRTVGLLVDAVSDIIAVAPGAVRPVPDLDLTAEDTLLQGLVPLEDRMVTLVSLDGLFRSSAAVEAATAAAAATASLAA
jgi:purine-binding chemotaxis protein CheW